MFLERERNGRQTDIEDRKKGEIKGGSTRIEGDKVYKERRSGRGRHWLCRKRLGIQMNAPLDIVSSYCC